MIANGTQPLGALVNGANINNTVLRDMIDQLPVAVYTTDAEGRLTYFNSAARTLSGREPELGTDKWCVTWKIFLPNGSPLPHDQCPMARALQGYDVSAGAECMAERPDGTRFWFMPYPAVLRDSEGRITGGINVLVDITERKNAQLESDESFRAIVETTPECVKIVAADGSLRQMNSAGLAMVEASCAQDVIGRNIYDVIAPEDRDRFREFNEKICSGQRGTLEFDIIGLRGTRRHLETHAAPLRKSDGSIVQLAITHDITYRWRAEDALRASEEEFRGLANAIPQLVWMANPDGWIYWYNDGWYGYTGTTPKDMEGWGWQSVHDPTVLPAVLEKWRHSIATGEPFEMTFPLRGADGIFRPFLTRIVPVRDHHGRVTRWFGTNTDVSPQVKSEKDLRFSQNRLHAALAASATGTFCWNPKTGEFLDFDENLRKLFGFAADEPVRVTEDFIGRVHPEDLICLIPAVEACRRGADFEMEYRVILPDGSIRWLYDRAKMEWQNGQPTYLVGACTDITGRKQSEEAQLRLAAIVESSDDAIISKDLNGIIKSWNRSAERVFGYTAPEAIGKSITILIPPDREDEEPRILARLRRGERVDHFETKRRRKDGVLIDISLTISPVKDSTGRIIGASKIARDISDRKRVEAELVASELRFRQLADSMPQIVWTARSDGQVDYYNERWYEFTGFSYDIFGEKSWLEIIHPDDVAGCRELWEACVGAQKPYEAEHRFWDRHQNRWKWFMARAVPVRHGQHLVKWFGSFIDIHEHKRIEEDLRRANRDLEQFAFSASHDLQEPLRGIKIYSELLEKRYGDRLDGNALKFLGNVRNGASRMEALVRDLLAYTQATKADAAPECVDSNRALQAALSNLSSAISESGAEIKAEALPSLPVHETHLQQLFQNIVGNAIKYRSPDRRPIVRVSTEKQNECWLFSVSDNGLGIDPEYKESIFGIFKRLHACDEYSGTGIGLAICERIVDRYDGRIWVESEPGQGSTFRFTLPA